jgi:hypothetical protein
MSGVGFYERMGVRRKRRHLTLFQNGIVCEDDERPWTIQQHPEFKRDYKWYAKKRPRELAAVFANLKRLENMLNSTPHSQLIVAGFIHPEPIGIWALDQRGSTGNLQATRLYCYAENSVRNLYLLAIGSKDSQSADISRVTEIVKSILEY